VSPAESRHRGAGDHAQVWWSPRPRAIPSASAPQSDAFTRPRASLPERLSTTASPGAVYSGSADRRLMACQRRTARVPPCAGSSRWRGAAVRRRKMTREASEYTSSGAALVAGTSRATMRAARERVAEGQRQTDGARPHRRPQTEHERQEPGRWRAQPGDTDDRRAAQQRCRRGGKDLPREGFQARASKTSPRSRLSIAASLYYYTSGKDELVQGGRARCKRSAMCRWRAIRPALRRPGQEAGEFHRPLMVAYESTTVSLRYVQEEDMAQIARLVRHRGQRKGGTSGPGFNAAVGQTSSRAGLDQGSSARSGRANLSRGNLSAWQTGVHRGFRPHGKETARIDLCSRLPVCVLDGLRT